MRWLTLLVSVVLLASACGDDTASSPTTTSTESTTTSSTTSPTTSTSSTSTSTTSTTSTTTTTTTTEAPGPECDATTTFGALDSVISDARLPEGGEWSTDVAGNPFSDDTADPGVWVAILGLDCAAQLTQPAAPGDRLALVAWTGPRMAFVVRSSETPAAPFAAISTISVGFENPVGEYLRDDNSLWGGSLSNGETFLVGHLDFNFGIAAKTWQADAPPVDDAETTLDAERAGIAAIRAAGGRNVGIAQYPELGSEEGYVMFVSPTGQILVVDVAPLGWFDPTSPRYYTGITTTETFDGIEVRVSEPGPGEGEYDQGVEVGWTCGDFVWILEPAGNGSGDEMVDFVETLVGANAC